MYTIRAALLLSILLLCFCTLSYAAESQNYKIEQLNITNTGTTHTDNSSTTPSVPRYVANEYLSSGDAQTLINGGVVVKIPQSSKNAGGISVRLADSVMHVPFASTTSTTDHMDIYTQADVKHQIFFRQEPVINPLSTQLHIRSTECGIDNKCTGGRAQLWEEGVRGIGYRFEGIGIDSDMNNENYFRSWSGDWVHVAQTDHQKAAFRLIIRLGANTPSEVGTYSGTTQMLIIPHL